MRCGRGSRRSCAARASSSPRSRSRSSRSLRCGSSSRWRLAVARNGAPDPRQLQRCEEKARPGEEARFEEEEVEEGLALALVAALLALLLSLLLPLLLPLLLAP